MISQLNIYVMWIYTSGMIHWRIWILINRLTCPGQCQGLYEDRQDLGHHHRWVRHSEVMRLWKKIHELTNTLRKKPKLIISVVWMFIRSMFDELYFVMCPLRLSFYHHIFPVRAMFTWLGRTSGISSVTMSTMWAGVMSSSLSGPESCFFPRLRFSFLFFFSFFFFSALSFCRRSSSSFTYWSDMGRPVCD